MQQIKSKGPEDLLAGATKLTPLVLKVKELSWGIIRNYTPCLGWQILSPLKGKVFTYRRGGEKKSQTSDIFLVSMYFTHS